jgi:hypothetical protein
MDHHCECCSVAIPHWLEEAEISLHQMIVTDKVTAIQIAPTSVLSDK